MKTEVPIIYWPLELTLKVAGFWPNKFNILGPLLIGSNLVFLLPFQCWDAGRLINNPIVLMDSLSDIITEFLLYIKLIIMWSKRRYIIDVLNEISEDFKEKEVNEKWTHLNQNANRFCKYDYSWYVSATFSYYIQFCLLYMIIPTENREMILKAKYPFNYQSSPVYEILNVVQAFQAFMMASSNAMSESLLVALVSHAGGHIDLITDQIKLFSNSCKEISNINSIKWKESRSLMSEVLRRHLKVLNLVKKIECFYTFVSLAQMLCSTFSICVTGFVIITAIATNDIVLLVKFITFIFVLIWQIFSFCYSGQYLINKNETVSSAMYDTPWYNIQAEEIKDITFIIKKAQIPLCLTAGKYITLSVQSFTTIIKTSFSYLSVLRVTYL